MIKTIHILVASRAGTPTLVKAIEECIFHKATCFKPTSNKTEKISIDL